MTREHNVPVTLNGQGGDEVFAGYWQSYFVYLRGLWKQKKLLSLSGHLAGAMTPWGNFHLLGQIPVMFRRYRDRQQAAERKDLHPSAETGREKLRNRLSAFFEMTDQERRVYEIREMHLPRLLKWDDRNFMAFSVEGRYPFLDHQLIETTLSFDPRTLYSAGWTKEPLRRAMADRLPRDITRRRTKFGFETPQIDWMLGPLRPLLESFAAEDSPVGEYVSREYVQTLANSVWQSNGQNEGAAHELFRLFLVNRWLRCFQMDLVKP